MGSAMRNMFPTGTITFLFTDIEGSTPLWEQHRQEMAEALQIHNSALRQAIEANGGAYAIPSSKATRLRNLSASPIRVIDFHCR